MGIDVFDKWTIKLEKDFPCHENGNDTNDLKYLAMKQNYIGDCPYSVNSDVLVFLCLYFVTTMDI